MTVVATEAGETLRTILVVGDSLGCPRPWEGVRLDQTYAYLLQRNLGAPYFVVNTSASETSTAKAAGDGYLRTYVKGSGCRYAVIQLGIVDCAPRLMSTLERLIVGMAARVPVLRIVNRAYVRFKGRHRYTLTRLFPKTLVPLDAFEANMRRLLAALDEEAALSKVIVIEIAAPGQILAEKSYGISENIDAYNGVLRRLAHERPDRIEVLDFNAATRANPGWITVSDGHHITHEAHAFLADQLTRRIKAMEDIER